MKTRSVFIMTIFTLLGLIMMLILTFSRIGIKPAYAESFSVGDAAGLITALEAANSNGETDVIILTADITLSSIDNTTDGPNGLPVILADGGNELVIEGSGHSISRSTAGGIPDFRIFRVAEAVNLTLNQLTIANGVVPDGWGGGIFNSGSLTITNSTLSDNTATYGGGGVWNEGLLTLNNSTLSSNMAEYGGGIENLLGSLTITNSILSDNTATYGGGIFNGYSLMIENSSLSGNTAKYGGGIFNAENLTINDSTLSDNTATYGGGGFWNEGGHLLTNNSTLSGNTATYNGGGIRSVGYLVLKSSTLSGNIAEYGGGIRFEGGSLSLTQSLISGNDAALGGAEIDNSAATVITSNYNLFGHSDLTNSQAFSGFAPAGTDINATADGDQPTILASILTPLADNGGPTLTHALVVESPAIDAAGAPPCLFSRDQRGISRPQGLACDIGAFELDDFLGPAVSLNQAAGQADPTQTSPILFTAIFSDAINVTTFTASDITLGGTAPGTLMVTITEAAPFDSTTFDIAVSGMSGSGTVTVMIAANTVQDLNGHGNSTSNSTDNEVTYQSSNGSSNLIYLPIILR